MQQSANNLSWFHNRQRLLSRCHNDFFIIHRDGKQPSIGSTVLSEFCSNSGNRAGNKGNNQRELENKSLWLLWMLSHSVQPHNSMKSAPRHQATVLYPYYYRTRPVLVVS